MMPLDIVRWRLTAYTYASPPILSNHPCKALFLCGRDDDITRQKARTQEVTLDINPHRIRRGPALLVLAMALACRRSYPLGKLSVQTVDANYAPVRGVAADLFKVTPSGHVYWRASRTGGNGFAVFGENNGGVIEGDYVVGVSLMPGQTLAPGESNDRAVKLRAGDNTVVTFRVVPWKPVRPTLRYTP